jgi:protein phosphatase
MGTTTVGALVCGDRMSVGHVGDSRLYLLRQGSIRRLTDDDSWAAMVLAHDPRLNAADIARHPMRNVLTNVLGARGEVDVHVSEHELQPGDIVLLSSDGLHGVLDDQALVQIATSEEDIDASARKLVEAALEGGSRDNVTALLFRFEGASA